MYRCDAMGRMDTVSREEFYFVFILMCLNVFWLGMWLCGIHKALKEILAELKAGQRLGK
jgi:hypothetical protein